MITSEQEALRGWFTGRLPEGLFSELVEISVDREEITVVGRIPAPELDAEVSAAEREAAIEGRIAEFRERTRDARIGVAREAERRYGRKVSWGAECDGVRGMFTTVSAPVMTRLRQPERQVLDTLVEAGVARSRSDALAWCVRLVQRHTEDWLGDLQESLETVRRLRAQGPDRAPEAGSGEAG
jgi:hypothetical protein